MVDIACRKPPRTFYFVPTLRRSSQSLTILPSIIEAIAFLIVLGLVCAIMQ